VQEQHRFRGGTAALVRERRQSVAGGGCASIHSAMSISN
jgi:hypothetical protein